MSSGEDHRRWEEDLPAYALGALPGADAELFDAHVATCERCAGQLRWLEPAVSALPASVEQLEPPARMRRRVMARARADLANATPARASGAAGRWRLSLRPALAVAGVVAIALAVGAGYAIRDGGENAPVVAATVADDSAAGARASLILHGDGGTLEVSGLPPLRHGDVYQAWLRDGSEIEPSTVFVVDGDGDGAAVIAGVEGADELMLTREPRGGSSAPSTAPLLRAAL